MDEKVSEVMTGQKEGKGSCCTKDTILIASLGALSYQTTKYVYGSPEKVKETNYAFHAVCEIENPNKLLLIGTIDSFWHQLVEFFIASDEKLFDEDEKRKVRDFVKREKEPKADAGKLLENKAYAPLLQLDEKSRSIAIDCIISADRRVFYKAGTQSGPDYGLVEQFIKKALNLDQVKIIIVPVGVDNSQQEEYFYLLRDGLSELISNSKNKQTEILFDVTYGFRSMPLYIMMLIRYFDLLKSRQFVFKAYYGVFEARDKEQNKTPLMDLTIVPIMTDWINALHEFIEFGSVKTLIKCLESEQNGKSQEDKKYIGEVIKEFSSFEYAMNANNLYYLIRGIVFITGLRYLSIKKVDYESLDVNHTAFSPQAKMMLETIREDYSRRFSTKNMEEKDWCTTESYVLAQIAKLYTAQGNFGDAAIAFQEGVLTYVMERLQRNEIRQFNNISTQEAFYEYVHKYENREQMKQPYLTKLNKQRKKSEAIIRQKAAFDVVYSDIKDKIRNTQAHFRYDDSGDVPIGTMKRWLDEGINYLLIEMESGYTTEFNNQTGLYEIYRAYADKKKDDSRKRFFRTIFISEDEKKYRIAENYEELLRTKMAKDLRILKLSSEKIVRWVDELSNLRAVRGGAGDLAESTYGVWSKTVGPKGKENSLEAYFTQLKQEKKLQETLMSVLEQ